MTDTDQIKALQEKILQSPAYRLAYEDPDLMADDDLRPLRLQMELLKPERILQAHGINSTVVVFGSARTISHEQAHQQLEQAERTLANTPGNEDMPAGQLYYTGRAIRTIKIPVLTRPVNRGALIQLDDVTLKDVPSGRLRGTPMRHISELLGMAATRHLRPGRAIFKRDIEQPQIVKRGALVNIIFKAPGITLSTKGKAISGGALGDTISVLNVRSKRTIQVSVIAPNTVSPKTNTSTNTSRTAMAAAPRHGGTYE